MKIKNLLVMSAVLACGLTLASCDEPKPSTSNGGETATEVTVGIGYAHTFAESSGNYQLGLTTAFVAFEEDGTIADCRLDVVQVNVNTNEAKDGLVLKNEGVKVDDAGSVKTKLELGKDYNMKGSSAIQKEVDYQIEFFADWTVGQTVEEVKAKVDPSKGHGVAHHEELEGECTISCGDFVTAIEAAYANRTGETYEFVEGAQAGIGMVSGLAYGEKTWEISVNVGGVLSAEGKVVAAAMDEIVFPVKVEGEALVGDTSSKYLTDGVLKSKKVLGDAYAMAGTSPIGAEWDAQAEALEAAVIGLTSAEIKALKTGEGDLEGACTMTIYSYVSALAKANDYAPLEQVGPQA